MLPRILIKSDVILFRNTALRLPTRASANTVAALQHRGSRNSALKAFLRWTRSELSERCELLVHSAPEYSQAQYALKSVIYIAVYQLNLRGSMLDRTASALRSPFNLKYPPQVFRLL